MRAKNQPACLRRRRAAGFTLTDLCVVLAVVLLPLAGLPALVGGFGERDRRIRCASNLRQIGITLLMYANDNRGNYPRTWFDTNSNLVTVYQGFNSPNSFAPAGHPSPVGVNNVTAGLYLAFKTHQIGPEAFVCEGSDADPLPGPRSAHSDFDSRAHLAYAYQVPYPTAAARNAGFRFNNTLSSDFAIAADMGPGGAAVTVVTFTDFKTRTPRANSPNHGGDGQNVLYGDNHCEWQGTVFCGSPRPAPNTPRDNIYVFGADTPAGTAPNAGTHGGPVDQYDSVLLPTYADGAQPAAKFKAGGTRVLIPVVLLVLLVGVVVLVLMLRKKPKGPPPSYSQAPVPGAPPMPGR